MHLSKEELDEARKKPLYQVDGLELKKLEFGQQVGRRDELSCESARSSKVYLQHYLTELSQPIYGVFLCQHEGGHIHLVGEDEDLELEVEGLGTIEGFFTFSEELAQKRLAFNQDNTARQEAQKKLLKQCQLDDDSIRQLRQDLFLKHECQTVEWNP